MDSGFCSDSSLLWPSIHVACPSSFRTVLWTIGPASPDFASCGDSLTQYVIKCSSESGLLKVPTPWVKHTTGWF